MMTARGLWVVSIGDTAKLVEGWGQRTGLIPAREKADSEGLRRFESDGVDSLRG
jgi:hypothetical protein